MQSGIPMMAPTQVNTVRPIPIPMQSNPRAIPRALPVERVDFLTGPPHAWQRKPGA